MSVMLAGLVGFVGLVSPHLALRILKNRLHGLLVPLSGLIGALFFLFADILARLLGGVHEIPAGGLVAVIGAPILIFYLINEQKYV
jgi:iron complex transport system permease protein